MTKIILTIFSFIFLTQVLGQLKPKGIFVGVEKIKDYNDPANPNYKWYHLSKLTFIGDSVFLEQSPIAIFNTDTIFSASDGGFYKYAGIIQKYKGKTIADLTLVNCDYCPMKFVKFTPPRIIKDLDTAQKNSIDTSIDETKQFLNPKIEFKIMFIESTNTKGTILVNRNIYRRKRK